MKKYLFVLLLVVGLAIVTYGLALADNGPHGGYGPATDACAGCHRAHTAQASKLLVTSSTALCETCHASTGAGADTNVWGGVYLNRDAVNEVPAEGVAGRGLKGGGFATALMDTDDGTIAGVSPSLATTSAHTFDGTTNGTIWGNGAEGSGEGGSLALSCTNCHNPHGKAGTGGTATYRILRPVPNGSGAGTGVDVADETNKAYTIGNANGIYYGESYGDGLSPWCSQCHSRYLAGLNSDDTPLAGESIFTYRHDTSQLGLSCMSCHVAHGTAAVMGPNSGSVPWPGGATSPSGNARSSLLRLDNRGLCYKCHPTP